jgi:hypothetical protein
MVAGDHSPKGAFIAGPQGSQQVAITPLVGRHGSILAPKGGLTRFLIASFELRCNERLSRLHCLPTHPTSTEGHQWQD